MYNRYLPPDTQFRPVPPEESEETSTRRTPHGSDPPHRRTSASREAPHESHQPSSDLLSGLTGGLRDLLGSVFQNFSLENLDSGDILLILIILFLFLEGDNLDLVIALGLMLLLGLGEGPKKDAQPSA